MDLIYFIYDRFLLIDCYFFIYIFIVILFSLIKCVNICIRIEILMIYFNIINFFIFSVYCVCVKLEDINVIVKKR